MPGIRLSCHYIPAYTRENFWWNCKEVAGRRILKLASQQTSKNFFYLWAMHFEECFIQPFYSHPVCKGKCRTERTHTRVGFEILVTQPVVLTSEDYVQDKKTWLDVGSRVTGHKQLWLGATHRIVIGKTKSIELDKTQGNTQKVKDISFENTLPCSDGSKAATPFVFQSYLGPARTNNVESFCWGKKPGWTASSYK